MHDSPTPGQMTAILGLDADTVEEIVAQAQRLEQLQLRTITVLVSMLSRPNRGGRACQ